MRIYIANGTRQIQRFMYWVPGVGGKKQVSQDIPIGGQVMLAGEIDAAVWGEIVTKHHKYGMRHCNEIRGKEFIGLIFSTDKAVTAEKIRELMNHNHLVLIERGKRLRTEAAVMNSNIMENSIAEQDRPENLRLMEISIQEENAREDGQMSEGYRVDRNAQLPGLPPPVARQRRRKAA